MIQMLRTALFTFTVSIIGSFTLSAQQGLYFDPWPLDLNAPGVRLYLDISSPACNCPDVANVNPDDNPLYIWTWLPSFNRPLLNGQDVNNGEWQNSNENLRMQRDPDNMNLWYYDFLGASITEFYGVTAEQAMATNLHFLVKEKDATGNPEPKSPDLSISFSSAVPDPSEAIVLNLALFATGFTRPCDIVNSGIPGDERMFVVEQTGRIRILMPDASVVSTPFLNISSQVNSGPNEMGLLGLAFSPNYEVDGYIFVNYTLGSGANRRTRIARFTRNASNPDLIDEASQEVILEFTQDDTNHNGGQLEFGPDGYLYIASGDGGGGGDPLNRSQDLTSLLGKMLRIDVSSLPYSIPADNPFVGDDLARDEIWSYGLRNPWKFAFDELTGDLYMADVGQQNREEINFEPAGFAGGGNYGWRCYEGDAIYNLNGCSAETEFIFPVLDYAWGNQGNGFRCSITGGRVYRGMEYPQLEGKYIANDLCSGEYWILWQENGTWEHILGTNNFVGGIAAYGANTAGELFAVRSGTSGSIYKLDQQCVDYTASITEEGGVLSFDANFDVAFVSWFINGSLITGSAGFDLDIVDSGTYQAALYTEQGCIILSNELNVELLSTTSRNNHKTQIFPNPTTELLHVRADFEIIALEVYALDGRKVFEKQTVGTGFVHSLSVASCASGYYLVGIRGLGGEYGVRPFVKQ